MSTIAFPRPLTLRGRAASAERTERWARPALIALLVFTAAAYLFDLSLSGSANSFYAAAVQAGTKSWKAFLFGSLDASNFITVDKPPASIWVMALSGRIFGFSTWSMLVPQVLEGVAAVWLLHASVKRWFGSSAGLLAGLMLALTPVAALMFRFNNPDALLVCLLVAAAYCVTRALERASTKWVVAAGTMVGFAFLAKMMQAFLVLPAFGLVYLVAAPTSLKRRIAQLGAGAAAIAVSAGWWVAIVALWPAGSRPMIDGSSSNSIFDLILGYNGLGRIFGATGPGGSGGANFSGSTGAFRLFNDLMGGQAAWLLPASGIALVAGLWLSRRAPRTDRTRAAMLLWGGWLLVSGAVFSFSSGVIHTYYTVALAPAIAAIVAIGAVLLWRQRSQPAARAALAAAVIATAACSWLLLDRTPSWQPWLRVAIPVAATLAVAGLLAPRAGRRLTAATAVLALVACLAGPAAYSAQTITTAHTGSIPSAGPSTGANAGGPGGFGGGRGSARPTGARAGTFAGGPPAGVAAVTGGASRGAGGVGMGGPGGEVSTSSALVTVLKTNASSYRWVAAVSGSQTAASLELATGGEPVMAIGGFDNQGGQLSLAQFEQYVKTGQIHYYVASGSGGGGAGGQAGPGGGSSTSAITSWVKAHSKATTIGGQTAYDLTA